MTIQPFKHGPWTDRFWSYVDKVSGPVAAGDLGQCWLWTGGRDRQGYGQVYVQGANGRRSTRAARASFFLEHGRWPEPFALHRCDNPPCVRPSHLFEGTARDNIRDAVAKGRQSRGPRHSEIMRNSRVRGERNPLSKLTDAQVLEIRASTESQYLLAEKYGVDQAMIWRIRARKAWTHI